jgi:hypothetical protein
MGGFGKQIVQSFLPRGRAWNPAPGGDFDRLLAGIGDCLDTPVEAARILPFIRNPYRAPREFLPDLAKEYGLPYEEGGNEDDLRDDIASITYETDGAGLVYRLQEQLEKFGFGKNGYGLVVTANEPNPARPDLNTVPHYRTRATGLTDGRYPARASRAVYNVIASGVFNDEYPAEASGEEAGIYGTQAEPPQFPVRAAGKWGTDEGGYYLLNGDSRDFFSSTVLPPNDRWGLVFFIGGQPLRDGKGRIARIPFIPVPLSRRPTLHRIIMRVKPVHSWAAMFVKYTQ